MLLGMNRQRGAHTSIRLAKMGQIVAIFLVDQKISKFVLLGIQKIVDLKEMPFASHLMSVQLFSEFT